MYGNESLSFWGGIIWNQLPNQYKAAKTDNELKMKIKSWKGFEIQLLHLQLIDFVIFLVILELVSWHVLALLFFKQTVNKLFIAVIILYYIWPLIFWYQDTLIRSFDPL